MHFSRERGESFNQIFNMVLVKNHWVRLLNTVVVLEIRSYVIFKKINL